MTPRRKTRNNDEALSAFIAAKAEIDVILDRLKALSDDHFAFDPDAINWGAVGSLNTVAADLRKITDFLFGEGEHAS
ncbi:hypothetical protein [Ruegeria aquimaris]|uniref:Uncharacterized protein n=1 Tax=Ruegeria aquimaris TaxID=2984333 RepID=A0ABT3AL97_9RHOB|nr:hypothetical protein [Ruegeria sp. XHP0148]MCV2889448.1 hypothetical protein [Ruegeria sp. XHP0148]